MTKADIIVIGGGLAGLTAAIHLSKLNYSVRLFEKESFPHHKVCGEYLSREILPYFEFLNIAIHSLQPVEIQQLSFSTQKGKLLNIALPLGGLGISRFALDHFLFQKAQRNAVEIMEESILEIKKKGNQFSLKSDKGTFYSSKVVLAAFGKRSNLDKYLNRNFIQNKSPWLAVKAHYEAPGFPNNVVALHNFKGGYCGLSKTESGHINVCYLTSYNSFKKCKDPQAFQKEVLNTNPHLNQFFSQAKAVFGQPLSIAQVHFGQKELHSKHLLMLGDAAGLIHPLCGNGMAMAIHSAKMASEAVDAYFQKKLKNFEIMEKSYTENWNTAFQKRLKYGRWLQNILLNQRLAEAGSSLITAAPFLLQGIIRQTHGNPIQL